jgi:hypothetical protein
MDEQDFMEQWNNAPDVSLVGQSMVEALKTGIIPDFPTLLQMHVQQLHAEKHLDGAFEATLAAMRLDCQHAVLVALLEDSLPELPTRSVSMDVLPDAEEEFLKHSEIVYTKDINFRDGVKAGFCEDFLSLWQFRLHFEHYNSSISDSKKKSFHRPQAFLDKIASQDETPPASHLAGQDAKKQKTIIASWKNEIGCKSPSKHWHVRDGQVYAIQSGVHVKELPEQPTELWWAALKIVHAAFGHLGRDDLYGIISEVFGPSISKPFIGYLVGHCCDVGIASCKEELDSRNPYHVAAQERLAAKGFQKKEKSPALQTFLGGIRAKKARKEMALGEEPATPTPKRKYTRRMQTALGEETGAVAGPSPKRQKRAAQAQAPQHEAVMTPAPIHQQEVDDWFADFMARDQPGDSVPMPSHDQQQQQDHTIDPLLLLLPAPAQKSPPIEACATVEASAQWADPAGAVLAASLQRFLQGDLTAHVEALTAPQPVSEPVVAAEQQQAHDTDHLRSLSEDSLFWGPEEGEEEVLPALAGEAAPFSASSEPEAGSAVAPQEQQDASPAQADDDAAVAKAIAWLDEHQPESDAAWQDPAVAASASASEGQEFDLENLTWRF